MSKSIIFKGSAVALVTPFSTSGEVNYFELKHLIEFQLANNTDAIVILGTTGEASTITSEEREKIIKFTLALVSNKAKVIVGTGSNSTSHALLLTKQAEELGADGVLIVTPYYNKANFSGIIKHYKTIASKTNIPIIAYNVPSRTGVNITPEIALKLSKIKNIVGIKEASGNMSNIAEILHNKSKHFAVYSGDDMLTLSMLSMGASGVISVTANCYPSEVKLMCDYAFKGDFKNAKNIHDLLFDINKGLFLDINPICVKYYLSLLGYDTHRLRLPLTEPSVKIKTALKDIYNKYNM